MLLLIFSLKGSTNFNVDRQQEEIDLFFKGFVENQKREYSFKKVKYVDYGDSLAFKNWVHDSGIDTIYLKSHLNVKNLNLKNAVVFKKPVAFNKYIIFDYRDFYKYKRKNPRSNFNEYYAINFDSCDLMYVSFLVFNEERNKALIYYSICSGGGYVDLYSKKNSAWFFLKTIVSTT